MALLLGAVGARPARKIEYDAPSRVTLDLAAYHGVSGFLYEDAARRGTSPPELVDALKRRYVSQVRRHMLATASLASVAEAFRTAAIKWVALKGPVVVELLYERRPGRRGYFDLDVLVEPAQFGSATRVLQALGAELLDRNWRMLRRDLRGEVLYRLRSGIPLDLHWNVVNMYRLRMRVATPALIRRAVPLQLETCIVPTLDDDDAVLYLALHAALAGGDRLVWLKDVERSIRVFQPDWRNVLARAHDWRVSRSVGLILARSADLFDIPIPHAVIHDLLGPVERSIVAGIDRISPWAFGMGRTSAPTRLVARSIGHGIPAASAWIVWRTLRNLDPGRDRRESAFSARGGPADWRAFVSRVERQGDES